MAGRILIADDAPFITEIIKHTLEVAGYQILNCAFNGEEVLSYAEELQPDLILMDVAMPGHDGLTAAKMILAKQAQIVIVAMSSLNQEEVLCQAIAAGCSDFLPKPFTGEELLEIVEKNMLVKKAQEVAHG